jgi:hypothetical protein
MITLIYVVKLLALKGVVCEEIFCVHVAHTTNNIFAKLPSNIKI